MTQKIRKQINFALPRSDVSFIADLGFICQQNRQSNAAAIRMSVQHYARALKVAQIVQTVQALPQAVQELPQAVQGQE